MTIKAKIGWVSLGVVICLIAWFCYGLWSVERNRMFVSDAQHGDIVKVRSGLDSGLSANTHASGASALRMAVVGGHQDVIALLLERGADPTDALRQAIQQNRPEVVTLLISKGANVNDNRRLKPLQTAKEYKRTQIVAILKSAGATE